MVIGPLLTGFATMLSLILAIGAQNAFVLRQGLARNHVFWLCLLCAGSDAILVGAGVLGFGVLVEKHPMFPVMMTWAGAAFLLVYGALKLRAAWQGNHALQLEKDLPSLRRTLAIGAAFTWLNPHVYLDTLVLVGAVSTQYDISFHRYLFGIGAAVASFVFFFSLGYGARLLVPVMQSSRAWRILDGLIGVALLVLAVKLII
jgi:L-lysine exporter family protein LysE/ArgO